jgi:hypothetical protein
MPAFDAIAADAIGEQTVDTSGNGFASMAGVAATVSVGTIAATGNVSVNGATTLSGVAASSGVGVAGASGSAVVTLGQVAAAAAVNTVSANGGVTLASTASVSIVDGAGAPRSGLTGLKWAFFDQVTLDALHAPVARGVGALTDGNGVLTVNVTGTSLQPGQIGLLMFSDGDGTTGQVPPARAFVGPVQVA